MITLTHLIIAIAIVLVIALIALAIVTVLRKKNPLQPGPAIHIIIIVIVCIASAAAVGTAVTCGIAASHGLYTTDVELSKLPTSIARSPVDESANLARDMDWSDGKELVPPNDSVILLYRFSCHDCEDTHEKLEAKLATLNKKVYRVSSRSEIGQALTQYFGVNAVPTILATNANGKTSVTELRSTETGKPEIDESLWAGVLKHMGMATTEMP